MSLGMLSNIVQVSSKYNFFLRVCSSSERRPPKSTQTRKNDPRHTVKTEAEAEQSCLEKSKFHVFVSYILPPIFGSQALIQFVEAL